MIAIALALAALQPADSPRAFIETLYARYRKPDFSPFEHPERVFAPTLLGAISEDSRLARGEVGYLDGDPICQCQDPAGMRPSIVGVTKQALERATVKVLIRWENDKPSSALFSLVRMKSGWRIFDISSTTEPSLLLALQRSNRRQKR